MRFMVIVKATPESESTAAPKAADLEEMGKFNQEMINAGVMLQGDGLHPSSKGARISYKGGKTTVLDGPFAESKELVAGFWILNVRSLQDAIEWIKRAPFQDGEVEIRQVFELEDFSDITPAILEREARQREQLAKN